VAFSGVGLQAGDRAKWVHAGSEMSDFPCASMNDATISVLISADLDANFYFPAPGPLMLCYKFNFGGNSRTSGWQPFDQIRAAIVHFDYVLPRATAVNCSSNVTLHGAGFNSLLMAPFETTSLLKCNFTSPVFTNTSSVATSIQDASLQGASLDSDVLMDATVVNDSHIMCATPMAPRTGVMPIAFDVIGGNYTDVHGATFDFLTYDVEDSFIQSLRMLPDGGYPVGGAYNLPAALTAAGAFEDYGVPRCRFTSTDSSGGVVLSHGAIVHNASFLTCDKPLFHDSTRNQASRYDVRHASYSNRPRECPLTESTPHPAMRSRCRQTGRVFRQRPVFPPGHREDGE